MRHWKTAAALALASAAHGQSVASRISSPADRSLLSLLVLAEDRRAVPQAGDARERGLASPNPYLRAFTVRGLGRLEKAAVLPSIGVALSDSSAEVRAAAADAAAQAVARGDSVGQARAMLAQRLSVESNSTVRAAALEAIGRLAQGSVDQVRATANLIAPSLAAADVVERRGAIRGLFFLARKREARAAGAIPTDVTDRLYALLDDASAGLTPTDRFNIAFALNGALALNDSRSSHLYADRDPMVRERGVVSLARSSDPAFVRSILNKSLSDDAPIVRFRSIAVYSQKLRATDGCGPLLALARDRDVTVALGVVDALSGCRNDTTVARALKSIADGLRDDDAWHLPAHAFVSLAVIDSAAARTLLPHFMGAKNFFVRMYADTAARLMGDVASLLKLSRDSHPNVQSSAIAALSRLAGHGADSVYIRALGSDDNQVLMSAAAALKGSSAPNLQTTVLARFNRRLLRERDTDRDGNDALVELAKSLGAAPASPERMIRTPTPTFDDLAALEKATARIEMADGAVIIVKLHPFDAPTNATRFARLARTGTFDGLTFHRVAPFFVVQGPSPNANEYSAPDGPFTRDELGVSNVRGTVGLSTRGRDTGDGQIYINTVDNVWLDHEYTVMGTITSGVEAFDRMQEGARIRRITITP